MTAPIKGISVSTVVGVAVSLLTIATAGVTYVTHENFQTAKIEALEKEIADFESRLAALGEENDEAIDEITSGIEALKVLNSNAKEQLSLHLNLHKLLKLNEK